MKKSPLSMPSGSRGKQSYNWKAHEHKSRTGYSYVKSDNYQCISPNGSQIHTGNDFIPLSISTPMPEQKRFNGNWHGSGNFRNHRSGSGGFNHYRNYYHTSPKSNFNNSYSPYKHSGKQFHSQKKGYQRDVRKQVDISSYIDMNSFLEDPWAELIKKLDKLKESNDMESPKTERLLSPQSNYTNSDSCIDSQPIINVGDSSYSQESKSETSLNVTLGLGDTHISDIPKTERSIDLKIDNVR